MSKSENVNATLYLADDDDTIRKKLMKAKTDAGPTEHNSDMPDYIQNIFQLLHLVARAQIARGIGGTIAFGSKNLSSKLPPDR